MHGLLIRVTNGLTDVIIYDEYLMLSMWPFLHFLLEVHSSRSGCRYKEEPTQELDNFLTPARTNANGLPLQDIA